MENRKVGVWLVGARGSISTTVIVGALALKKGLVEPTGMITATGLFAGMDLAAVGGMEFGGCDIRDGSLVEAARHIARETGTMAPGLLAEIEEDLLHIEREIQVGTAINCGHAIEGLAATSCTGRTIREEIEGIRECLRSFKQRRDVQDVVVINLASTEPPLCYRDFHHDADAFAACLDRNEREAVRASSLYALAAIEEGCPYINFTPSTAALNPAVVQLAELRGVPVMGNDGKTGETLVKSALAPMFLCRNLEVLSWEGFNLLGNMDGRILNNTENKESKLKTKDQVLSNILGYTPHSRVHIDYVPSLDDQKTAWDFIHFRGFLGAKMSLQFIWQGYDSLLAAPLVLDLARLAEFARHRGESGLMPHLASYFKAPLGVRDARLHEQFRMLEDYVEKARVEAAPKLHP